MRLFLDLRWDVTIYVFRNAPMRSFTITKHAARVTESLRLHESKQPHSAPGLVLCNSSILAYRSAPYHHSRPQSLTPLPTANNHRVMDPRHTHLVLLSIQYGLKHVLLEFAAEYNSAQQLNVVRHNRPCRADGPIKPSGITSSKCSRLGYRPEVIDGLVNRALELQGVLSQLEHSPCIWW
ncbi:hypothetical protein RRG08_051839 [Elysia crispata]|uniref:Uncharacterized protein n=1 Tax=Elysia crispata TaxID=231223 RepID=A0AAE0Z9K0_9GAST|nr:hypothetical protein RRG08_051839 [Elysia crispata]